MTQEQKTVEILMRRVANLEGVQNILYVGSPDMLWVKDKNGRYLWANSKTINALLLQDSLEDILHLTDVEIATKTRLELEMEVEEHTAGVVCTDTDNIVLREHKPMRFIEVFNIKGEVLVLEVHKNIARNSTGDVIGTTGVGRDVTANYNMLESILARTDIPSDVRVTIEKYQEEHSPERFGKIHRGSIDDE